NLYNDPEGYSKPVQIYLCPARRRTSPQEATTSLANGRNPWAITDYAINLVLVGRHHGGRFDPETGTFAQGRANLVRITDGASNTTLAGQKSRPIRGYNTGSWSYDEPVWCGGHNGTGRGYRGWPQQTDQIYGTVLRDDVNSTNDRLWGSPFANGCPFVFC